MLDEPPVGARAPPPRGRPSPRRSACSASSVVRGSRWSTVASSVAARVSSRFSRASAGSEYLSEMTSPCSVTLISPSSVPHGWARIASCVGPPPRPIGAAAAVEEPQPHAVAHRDVTQLALGPVDLPLGGRDARLLVRVGVAEHHLLHVPAQRDEAAVRRVDEQVVEDPAGLPQLAHGLEQRDEADAGDVAVQVDQAGLAGQQDGREQVVGAARHRDDVALAHLRAERRRARHARS